MNINLEIIDDFETDINNIINSLDENDEEGESSLNEIEDINLIEDGYELNHNYKNEIKELEENFNEADKIDIEEP